MEQEGSTCLARIKLSYVVMLWAVFAFAAKPALAQETVFGPEELRIGWLRTHLSFHKFTGDEPGEGIIIVSKNTPEKEIRGGFARLNGEWIPLQSFLCGESTVFEKRFSLRSHDYLVVFLRGDPGASVNVEVRKKILTPPPDINFSAYPTAIKLGEYSELTWNVANGETVEIEPGIGKVEASGSLAVSPYQRTAYILKAEGRGGTATRSVTVTVYQAPTVTLGADPETVTYGETSTLSWSSTNADKVSIDQNIGEVNNGGFLEVKPDRTTTYTINASGPGGSAQAQVAVTVKAKVEPQPEGSFGKQYEDLIPLDVTIEAYAARRFSVVTGLVYDVHGLPIADVAVAIHDHPEYGTSSTDGDGRFSIPVEGGGTITVVYQKERLITAHRKLYVPWNDIAVAEAIKMIAEDPAATTISFDGNPGTIITHQSTEVSDEFGTRSCTMVFTGDNQAYEVDAQRIVIRELGEITTRATEFATPESMPAILPPASAYTYCAELTVDGVERVKFAQPVIMWVDNFLGFDVGEVVPVGYYDRDKGIWIPSANGLVVRILDTDSDGVADALDAGGDGEPDDLDSDGMFVDEVKGLGDAEKYPPDSTFWRVTVTHFTPWDCNWPYGPPPDFIVPNPEDEPEVDQQRSEERDCKGYTSSFVEERSRILHEDIPIPGTDMTLHYASNRVKGFRFGIRVPASGEVIPNSLKRIIVKLEVAGVPFEKVLDPLPNQVVEFAWDGQDRLGRLVTGPSIAHISIGFVYNAVYYRAGDFTGAFAQVGTEITGTRARQELISWKRSEVKINQGCAVGKETIAEGWTLSIHHHLSPRDPSTLYKGDGTVIRNAPMIIDTVAGNGVYGYNGDGGLATETKLWFPKGVTVDCEGNLYIADTNNNRIRKVDINGIVTTVAFLQYPYDVTSDFSGNLYIADQYSNRIRKVDQRGVITTVAGSGNDGYGGDGGPATLAELSSPMGVAVDVSGNLYIADRLNNRIRKVDPRGIITTVAGNGEQGFSGDGSSAVQAQLYQPYDLALDSSGNIYIADTNNHRIRKVDASGIITTVAGNGTMGYSGDGGSATTAKLWAPKSIATDGSGNIYIGDTSNHRIRKVNPSGIITTVAGNGTIGHSGDRGPGVKAQLKYPWGVAVDASGALYVVDGANHSVRKVAYPAAFTTHLKGGDIPFYEATAIGHIVSSAGRHKTTIDLNTGINLYDFGYDQYKELDTITDRFGSQTIIERDGDDFPTAIVSPGGIRTELTIDGNNHLSRITYADDTYFSFEYTSDGLMTGMVEPEGNRFDHIFDALGKLTEATDEEGGHWEYTRTAYGNGDIVTHVSTGEGNLTSYLDHIDSTGSYMSTITDPAGAETFFVHSADKLSASKSLPCGTVLEFRYGVDPEYKSQFVKEMSESTPAGRKRIMLLEKIYQDTDEDEVPDKIIEKLTLNGKATILETDTLQGTKSITSPEGRSVVTSYDRNTLLPVRLLIPGLHDKVYGYDTRGRLVSISTDLRQSAFSYDLHGNLQSITDPENQTTTYSYDAVGRMTEISRPDTSSVAFSYDKNGNTTILTNPARIDHSFDYNKVNLNSSYSTPLSGSYTYLYDKDRRLIQVNFPSEKQINNLYGKGRLEQVQTPEGNVDFAYICGSKVDTITKGIEGISYGYDGSLVTAEELTGTLSESLDYGYHSDFSLASFTYAGGTVGYTYDNDGLLTGAGGFVISRNSGNGLPEMVTGGALSLSRAFNGYGEVEGQNSSINGLGVNSWSLSRDDVGRITAKKETVDGVASSYVYTYDPMGRLFTVTKDGALVEEYQYDSVGTRIYEMNASRGISARSFAYDEEDRLLTAGDATYQYDADGFLKTKALGTEETTYNYSTRGELLTVTLSDGTRIEYVHDPIGRRIAKKVNETITEKFLWQGLTRLLAVYDGSDNLLMRFLYADGRMPVAMEKGASVYYLSYDQVGSLRVVADGFGNVVKKIDYDSFGNITRDTNASFEIPFGFAGGLHDRDTGLVRFGFRDYDPNTARWTAKDPILLAGGDTDLYGYCLNDPINWVDPWGLYLTPGQRMTVAMIGTVGGLVGHVVGSAIPGLGTLAGSTIAASVASGIAAAYLGGDCADIANAVITGALSGAAGLTFGSMMTNISSIGVQAAGRAAVFSGVFESILMGAKPVVNPCN